MQIKLFVTKLHTLLLTEVTSFYTSAVNPTLCMIYLMVSIVTFSASVYCNYSKAL